MIQSQREYIQLMSTYRLRDSCRAQVDEFISGLTEIVPEILGSFDESDLDMLIGGVSEVDVAEMRRHTNVVGARLGDVSRLFDFILTPLTAMIAHCGVVLVCSCQFLFRGENETASIHHWFDSPQALSIAFSTGIRISHSSTWRVRRAAAIVSAVH